MSLNTVALEVNLSCGVLVFQVLKNINNGGDNNNN